LAVHLLFGVHSTENAAQFRKELAAATHVMLENDHALVVADALARNPHSTKASVLRELELVKGDVGTHLASQADRALLEKVSREHAGHSGSEQQVDFLKAVLEENLRRTSGGRPLLKVFYEPRSSNFSRDWEAGVATREFSDAVEEKTFEELLEKFRDFVAVKAKHIVTRENTVVDFVHRLNSPDNLVLVTLGSHHAPVINALRKRGVEVTANKNFLDPSIDAKLFLKARKRAPISEEFAARAMFHLFGVQQVMRQSGAIREKSLRLSRFLETKSVGELKELFNRAREKKQDLPAAIVEAAGLARRKEEQ